jgi:hypothetical protein
MADYKELLRRAISALPENNGAARRAVYEKARSALVGQLRAISPPLPARDITQHRLQLEDCIRQVEQEASEAVITLGREGMPAPRAFEPRPAEVKPAENKPAEVVEVAAEPVAQPAANEVSKEPLPPTEHAPKSTANMSIEEIIAEAAATGGTSMIQVPVVNRPIPGSESAVLPSRSEPVRAAPMGPVPTTRPPESLILPVTSDKRPTPPVAANSPGESYRPGGRQEPVLSGAQVAVRQQTAPVSVTAVQPALSAVREVELETVEPDASEAEGAIERAIETLDREARGESGADTPESAQTVAERMFATPRGSADDGDDSGFVSSPAAGRSGSGLTIFLVVFAILLAGVGGAGFWAWREGYIDLDQMFGQAQPVVAETADPAVPGTPTLDPVQQPEAAADPVAAPGNTATAPVAEPANTLEGLEADDRLDPTPEPVVPTGNETVLPPLADAGADAKGEERLPGQDASTIAANDPGASVDPAVLAGSQSLLLEASATGTTGAVPFSGTVEWREGVDELGLPTLIGHASIPARNLGVDVTIRKNSDPSLPASHLMEVDFQVSDTFIGGTVANLPGVLLKDQELVPGTPLVGASARVVGNSFLFALSATPADATTNTDLLENRKWMDLAVVYGTGRNAIITLEKDDDAQALFDKVFTAWAE